LPPQKEKMEKKKERLQSLLDRSRLEKSCYEMFYLQGVPVAEVARKTGLSRQTIYTYLRNFEVINPQISMRRWWNSARMCMV
jgi:AcrR family transcriptional regulator